MSIRARSFRDDGFEVMVTGTQDPAVAREYAIAEALDYAECEAFFEFGSKGELMESEVSEPKQRAWAETWVDKLLPRLTVGRIVPSHPDADYSWVWWEGLAPDRPGAFFALMYDRRDLEVSDE
jgi:hypothetical protein